MMLYQGFLSFASKNPWCKGQDLCLQYVVVLSCLTKK